MRLLYPTSPLQPREPDELCAEECAAAVASGFSVSLFSYEDFMAGTFRARPTLSSGDTVLYRGWMVTPAQYRELHAEVSRRGAGMLTSPEQYELCHHLPRWYTTLTEFIPETRFFQESDDVASRLRELSWTDCFLKDYVKSLATADGSLVTDLARIPEVIAKMKMYRGQIEGGICARRVEDFDHDTEDRYFVFRGTAYAREGSVPEVVEIAARRIASPFFSVDTVGRRDGVIRIIELGDGQVSDLKKWTTQQIISMLGRNSEPTAADDSRRAAGFTVL
jgi:ATP-grasp domain, R2K clade family 3